MSDFNVLLHVSGSISAYKACTLASLLSKKQFTVQVTMSPAAQQFSGKAAFEGITGREVLISQWDAKPDVLPHITLAQQWADLLLVYPGSADTINRLAAGLADDLFGAVFLANNFQKPVWIAPAMNSMMFDHPAVKESLKKLESWGCAILPTGEGRMACGTIGKGRLLDPEEVVNRIMEHRRMQDS
jgi:phosphopantothenoylcysteine decarboxylase